MSAIKIHSTSDVQLYYHTCKIFFYARKWNVKVPEMQGVRTPSPMTMEVPSMVANSKKYFEKWLFSSFDLSLDALFKLLLGNSILKVDTSRSSTSWLGIKPTFAYRHIREYNANVPPVEINQCYCTFNHLYTRRWWLISSIKCNSYVIYNSQSTCYISVTWLHCL